MQQGQRAFAGALAIYTAGGLFWAFLPFFIGLQVTSGGLTQAQAGSLGSAYLVGFSVASLSGLWWVRRFDWRVTVAAAAVIIVVCLLALARTDAYTVGLGMTAAVGLMMGSFWTIAYRIFGATPNPDRSFAVGIVVAYTALALVSYLVGQYVVPGYGLQGSAYFLSAIIVVLGFAALLVPSGSTEPAGEAIAVSYRPPARIALALLGILATGFAFAAVWAFAERIGVNANFDSSRISPVVASNLLASAAGSVLATVIGTRFGRRWTLLVGMLLMMVAILALLGSATYWLYAAGIVGLGFTIGFVLPFQMGALAALDTAGRFVVLITAAQGIGSAIGPLLGGVAVDAGGLRALLIAAVSALAIAAIIFSSISTEEEGG